MRKGAKFTARKLERWAEQGRGQGRGDTYQPWHQATRGDPASLGRTHLQWSGITGRHQHLLSDGELLALMWAWVLPGVVDILEQCPLDIESGPHVLARYHTDFAQGRYAGTAALAERLAIAHPRVREGERFVPSWVMSTDCVVILRQPEWRCLAISVKPASPSRRDEEKLRLEQAYWRERGARWQLFIKDDIPVKLSYAVRSIVPHVLPYRPPTAETRRAVVEAVGEIATTTLARALEDLQQYLGIAPDTAQALFWQGVWLGDLPVSLEATVDRGGLLRPATYVAHKRWNALDCVEGF